MSRLWLLLPVLTLAACPKKAPEVVAPVVGWFQEEGWQGQCYAPPDFDAMGEGERRVKRGEAMAAVVGQWRGQRNDGISFDAKDVMTAETQILRFPDKLGPVLQKNLAFCKTVMAGGAPAAWARYVSGLAQSLRAGECNRPLDATMVWYLDISIGWQFRASVCAGEPVDIDASDIDYYRIAKDGIWMTAAGDSATSTAGQSEYPCSTEGCLAGELVLRFTSQDGSQVVKPLGSHLIFNPPTHGEIEVMINDTTFGDNSFKVERGVQHHTQVTYKPAAK